MTRPSAFYCFHRKQFKVVCVKLSAVFVLLALVMAQAFAYDVGIKVTVSQDTIAVGTNISIVKDGTLLYSAKADGNGAASFVLDTGSYFVYLDRGGYSRHVNILEVGKNENIAYTMRQLISYASAYGQMTGPADFNGTTVTAYLDGNVAKRISPNKDGYYIISYMPEGNYEIAFNSPGFVEKNVSATLLQSVFSEVNVKLDKTPVAPIAQPTMTVPRAVQKQSVIEILILKEGVPMAGQIVLVKMPAGNVEITTGADGKAHVNAVKAGEYVFTYGNLTSITIVEGEKELPAPKPIAPDPEPSVPIAPEPQKKADNGLATGVVIAVIGGLIVVIGIILFVLGKAIKKQKPKAEAGMHSQPEASETEHAAEHKHAHAHKHEAADHAHTHGHKKQM